MNFQNGREPGLISRTNCNAVQGWDSMNITKMRSCNEARKLGTFLLSLKLLKVERGQNITKI